MSASSSSAAVQLGSLAMLRALVALVWRASPRFFVCLLVLTVLSGLTPLALMLVSARLLDSLVVALQAPQPVALLSSIVPWLVLLGGVRLMDQLLARLRGAIEGLHQTLVTNHVRLLITSRAAALDLAFFENPEFHNQLSNALGEASYRPLVIVTQLLTLVASLTSLVSVTVLLLLWQPWIVPLILLCALVLFAVTARFGRERAALMIGRTATARTAEYTQTLLTVDWVAKEVRLFGLRDFLLGRLRGLLDQMYRQDRRLARRQTLSAGGVELVLFVVRPLLIGFAAWQTLQRAITIGQFSLYTQAIVFLEEGLTRVLTGLAELHEHQLFVANLFQFLALEPEVEIRRDPAGQPTISARPQIEFRNVSFSYPDRDQPVIEGLSFTIRPGEKIALVGTNGAGKTTLVKLLTGLYRPTMGQILFDGIDIETLDRAVLRDAIGVIFQDYAIYHLSLSENIGIGRVDLLHDQARIQAAARHSGLDRVVERLPDGYATVLGRWIERGHELSGGQRQLVAITRAMLRDAPVLVLDEPTAALDPAAEQRFFHAMLDTQRTRDQTLIFISHRFSTIRRADRILVLEGGRIIEQGSHDTLMARAGRYAELFTIQAEPYQAESVASGWWAVTEQP